MSVTVLHNLEHISICSGLNHGQNAVPSPSGGGLGWGLYE